jgi:hypothetical protein
MMVLGLAASAVTPPPVTSAPSASAGVQQATGEAEGTWPLHLLPLAKEDARSAMLGVGFASLLLGGAMAAAPLAFYGGQFAEQPSLLLTSWPGWLTVAGLAGATTGMASLLGVAWVEMVFPWLNGWKDALGEADSEAPQTASASPSPSASGGRRSPLPQG